MWNRSASIDLNVIQQSAENFISVFTMTSADAQQVLVKRYPEILDISNALFLCTFVFILMMRAGCFDTLGHGRMLRLRDAHVDPEILAQELNIQIADFAHQAPVNLAGRQEHNNFQGADQAPRAIDIKSNAHKHFKHASTLFPLPPKHEKQYCHSAQAGKHSRRR